MITGAPPEVPVPSFYRPQGFYLGGGFWGVWDSCFSGGIFWRVLLACLRLFFLLFRARPQRLVQANFIALSESVLLTALLFSACHQWNLAEIGCQFAKHSAFAHVLHHVAHLLEAFQQVVDILQGLAAAFCHAAFAVSSRSPAAGAQRVSLS